MGTIRIIHGQEFKYIREYNDGNDVFNHQYKLAANCLEEIVSSNGRVCVVDDDCLNNIIAFTGDRGQGKTSAMMTFTNQLMRKKDVSSICFGEKTKAAQFLELKVVDPSTFENMHNVVEVIVTKMYNDYMEKWRAYKKSGVAEFEQMNHRQMLESFQLVYEGLSLVRNPRKFDDLEQDFEGTISKIARAGDSSKLKQNMQELVSQYLKIFLKNNNFSFLVIPIDDLDVNISLAYKMMEQIRKYLILPNVILIMAVKMEQLHYCVELQFRKEMALLIEKKQRIFDEEPIDMATKYVAKLIPDARRISLPELRFLVSKNEEDESFEVEYIINGRNIFSVSEDMDEGTKYTFEKKLLMLIYKTTGLVFVCSNKQVHSIVPHTLRELVNLASVLGKMNTGISQQNLEVFEDYFINTWISSQLDDGYIRDIRSLFLVQTPALHIVLCSILLDKLENLDAYTLDNYGGEDKKKTFSMLKEYFYKRSQIGFSLGDVVSLLNFVENRYTDQTIKIFVFSVRTIYSIIMCKMVLNRQNIELSSFVGSSVFGRKIISPRSRVERYTFDNDSRINDMVQTSAAENASRVEFLYSSKIYLDHSGDYLAQTFITENKEKISLLLFFSSFSNSFQYFISGNNSFEKQPKFSLENLFISSLYNYNKKFSATPSFQSDVETNFMLNQELIIAVTTNLEFLEYLYEYCKRRKDSGRTTTDTEHIQNFLCNINDATKYCINEILFDEKFINWVTTSFEYFWECRIDNIVLSVDEINSLHQKIELAKISRICKNIMFQSRAQNILYLCENIYLFKNNTAQNILANIRKQISFSMEQDADEKIDSTVKINFNGYLNELLGILNKSGGKS